MLINSPSSSTRVPGALSLTMFVAVLVAAAPPARAAVTSFKVDFGLNDTGPSNTPNDVQSDFFDYSINPIGAFAPFDQGFSAGSIVTKNVNGISVSVSGVAQSNGPMWLDYTTNVTNSLGHLLEDGISATFDNLFLDIKNLLPGTYQMTTYHHDAGAGAGSQPFDILANTGLGDTTVATNVPVTTGFTPSSFSSATFPLTIGASGEVVITFKGSAGQPQMNTFVNGFTLATVPEPSSLALAAFGLVGLAAWRSRRASSAIVASRAR